MTVTSEDFRVDAPRNDLIRGLMPLRAEDNGSTMVGYPIVFNQWAEIDSWEGRFLERVLPSAPLKSMKEGRQKVQYNHGMHPLVGSSGLGKPRTMKRDSFGVYVEVPLSDTSYNRDIIKPLLADGVLNGMSFRFSVVEDRWKKPAEPTDENPEMLPERSLVEFKWPEFGPVDWPAYEATQAGIRSQAAFALWLQTPPQQRSELMREFHINVPAEPTLWAPGWEPRGSAPKTVIPDPDPDPDPEPSAEREERVANLVREGFDPDSVVKAVMAQDEAPTTTTEDQHEESADEDATDDEPRTTSVTDEPPGSEHSSSPRRMKSTRHQRELTLAYVTEMLDHSKRRSQEHEQRVRTYERLTGKA